MLNDTTALIALGCGALLAVWLVFSLLKKVLGLALLAGLALVGYLVWNNPVWRDAAIGWIGGL